MAPASYRLHLGTHALLRNGTRVGSVGTETLIFSIYPGFRAARITVIGTDRSDNLTIGARRVNVQGMGGDDRIEVNQAAAYVANVDGGAGDDYLVGDNRIDHLSGGPGDDHMFGGSRDDTLVGERAPTSPTARTAPTPASLRRGCTARRNGTGSGSSSNPSKEAFQTSGEVS